jgi:signal peptidase I
MRRLALLAAVGAALMGCGAESSPGVVLQPMDPRLANVYLQVRAPTGVPNPIWRLLSRSVSSTGAPSGFTVARAPHGHKDCSFTHKVPSDTLRSLRKYQGRQIGLAVYGDGRIARVVCQRLSSERVWEGERLYRIPSSSMEPTLECAKGGGIPGCSGRGNDLVVVRLNGITDVRRRDVVLFTTSRAAALRCGEAGVFVKRVIGLPGETVHEDEHGVLAVDGKRLAEPYIPKAARLADSLHFGGTWHVPSRRYFVLGDNRAQSCDSRTWGSVPARSVIGPVVKILRGGEVLRPAGVR